MKKQSLFNKYKFLILAIAYLIVPTDLIPDFLAPIIGPLVAGDDITVLFIAVAQQVYNIYKTSNNTVKEENKSIG